MTHQELYLNNIHRFELTTNSFQNARECAFNFYGILLIPAFVGIFFMYNVLQLRNEYFIITLLTLVVILANAYFYYQRKITKTNELKLIIDNDYIQLMDSQQIYFQEQISQVNIEPIRCGKNLHLAIKLNAEYFEGIVIGLKNTQLDISIKTENPLSQPDYWLANKKQAKHLVAFMDTQRI